VNNYNPQPEIRLPTSPGFNIVAPNEPISPMDCARWPDSPFCGGDIPGSNRPGVLRPLAGLADFRLADWGSNDCESWVGFAPRLLGTTLSPPIYFHWREANCQPQTEPIEPELIPPTEPGGPARFWPNRSSQGRVQGCRYFVSIAIESDGSLMGQDWEFPAFNPWGHWSGLLAGICIPAYGPIAELRCAIAAILPRSFQSSAVGWGCFQIRKHFSAVALG
jgi:hypothetical protein